MNSRIANNVLYNFGGQVIPLVIALFTMPFLIERLGDDRFGLLSISWMVVGYLSLFDFGLGRAMTQQVAVKLGLDRHHEVPDVFWTAMWTMLALGLAGAIAGGLAAPSLATTFLNIPGSIEDEARHALVVLAFGIPITILSTGLRGFIEAFQEFRLAGLVRLINGTITFLVPAVIAAWTPNIAIVVTGLVVFRLAVALLSFAFCLKVFPASGDLRWPSVSHLRDLFSVGGWMTVSNVISPVMTSLDRFLLGAMLSVSAVTYYATPVDTLTRVLIIPGAITGVLFPTFAKALHSDRPGAFSLFNRSWDATFYVVFPIVFVTALLAEHGLSLWLGEEFVAKSVGVVQWLSIGVLANSLAQLPHSLLQSSGRTRTVALIHLIELPLYIGLVLWLVREWGITGAAMAWTARAVIDLVALYMATRLFYKSEMAGFRKAWMVQGLLLLLMIVGCAFEADSLGRLVVLSGGALLILLPLRRVLSGIGVHPRRLSLWKAG
ncbi:MAG: flippase [Thermomicrobiales bacterium]